MSAPIDPEPRPADAPGPEEGRPSDAAPPAAPGGALLWPLALGTGVAAALGAWLIGEALLDVYHDELTPPRGAGFPPPEAKLAMLAVQRNVATMIFAAQGALLGLALGIAGGVARRSVAAASRAGIAGLLLGAAAVGPIAAGLLRNFFANHDLQDDDLLLPLMTHAGIAAAIGAAGGVALGIGLGARVGQTLTGGLLGAAIGATLYEVGGALAFPTLKTSDPISDAPLTRVLLHLAVTLVAAAGAVWAARTLTASRAKPAPPAA